MRRTRPIRLATAVGRRRRCAHRLQPGQLSADSFTVSISLSLLAFAYLGGITSMGGALVAGTLAPLGIGYVVLDRAFQLGKYHLLVSGALLVVTAIFDPTGIAGTVRAKVAPHLLPVLAYLRPGIRAPATPEPIQPTGVLP